MMLFLFFFVSLPSENGFEMNNVCQLSIIVPVYNVEKYIRACIESIFRQNLDEKCFEVIIVNDGTKDHSMEVIQDIINQHSNITVINQENLSLSVARNNGIAKAKGEYILMPDSDDLLIDDSLSVLLDLAIESQVDIVVADFIEMSNEAINDKTTIPQRKFLVKEKTGEELFLQDLNPRQCYVWRTLFKREFLLQNKLKFVPGIRYQDVPFTHECYLKAKRCLKTTLLLNIYRRGQESATYSFNLMKAKELCLAIANTWKLKHLENMPSEVLKKLNDNLFASFSLLIYFMLYGINSPKEREEIFAFLRNEIPDLSFSNGLKQKITSFLFNNFPHFYFDIRLILKRFTPKPNVGFSCN